MVDAPHAQTVFVVQHTYKEATLSHSMVLTVVSDLASAQRYAQQYECDRQQEQHSGKKRAVRSNKNLEARWEADPEGLSLKLWDGSEAIRKYTWIVRPGDYYVIQEHNVN